MIAAKPFATDEVSAYSRRRRIQERKVPDLAHITYSQIGGGLVNVAGQRFL